MFLIISYLSTLYKLPSSVTLKTAKWPIVNSLFFKIIMYQCPFTIRNHMVNSNVVSLIFPQPLSNIQLFLSKDKYDVLVCCTLALEKMIFICTLNYRQHGVIVHVRCYLILARHDTWLLTYSWPSSDKCHDRWFCFLTIHKYTRKNTLTKPTS